MGRRHYMLGRALAIALVVVVCAAAIGGVVGGAVLLSQHLEHSEAPDE